MKMQEDKVCGQMWQTFLGRKSHTYRKTRRMGGPTGRCRSDDHGKNPRLYRELNAGRLDSNPLLSQAHNIHPKHTFYTDTSKTCHNFHSHDTTLMQVARRTTILTKERTSNSILFRMWRFVTFSQQKSLQITLLQKLGQILFFIVVPCILITLKFLSPTNAPFITHIKY